MVSEQQQQQERLPDLLCVVRNASEKAAKKELVCVKKELQKEKEMQLASFMLASDLASKLDTLEAKRGIIGSISLTA